MSEVGFDQGRGPTSADANIAVSASKEEGGDEGMKRKKKSSFKADAGKENWRDWQ